MELHTRLDDLNKIKPALTVGVFDGIHLGHQKLLDHLKEKAQTIGAPSMVVSFWPHPYQFFHPEDSSFRLLMSLREKELVLANLGIDHLVVLPFDYELAQTDAAAFIKNILVDQLGVRHLVVGDDHRFGKDRAGSIETASQVAESFGFGLSGLDSFVSEEVRISSTFIRSCLLAGDLTSANKMLGYPYFILGRVERGKQLGTKIGFATANIACCEAWKQIPVDGVYAVAVEWNGSRYGGMLNIGLRPTVENSRKKSIEVHLFGHEGELYGEELKVSFIQRLRDEMQFNNLDELREQLIKDERTAREVLKAQ